MIAPDNAGRVDLVWGVGTDTAAPDGEHTAPIVVENVAPNP